MSPLAEVTALFLKLGFTAFVGKDTDWVFVDINTGSPQALSEDVISVFSRSDRL